MDDPLKDILGDIDFLESQAPGNPIESTFSGRGTFERPSAGSGLSVWERAAKVEQGAQKARAEHQRQRERLISGADYRAPRPVEERAAMVEQAASQTRARQREEMMGEQSPGQAAEDAARMREVRTEIRREINVESATPTTEVADQNEKKVAKVKSFKTARGSIYTYDQDGKTTRFKTATNEQHVKQDLTVFVNLKPDEEQDYLHAYRHEREEDKNLKVYVLLRQPDDTPKILRNISEVADPDNVYLGIAKAGKIVQTNKASITPAIGSTPFDTRHFQDENGNWQTERHLGNKIVDIEFEDQNIPADSAAGRPAEINSSQPDRSTESPQDIERKRIGFVGSVSRIADRAIVGELTPDDLKLAIAGLPKGDREVRDRTIAVLTEKFKRAQITDASRAKFRKMFKDIEELEK